MSPFFGAITPAPNTREDDNRQREFENSIGNLLVAEYQCDRLRTRIRNHLASKDELTSEFMFKIDSTWYRINISAQKQEEQKKEEEEAPKKKKKQTHGFALIDDEEIPVP